MLNFASHPTIEIKTNVSLSMTWSMISLYFNTVKNFPFHVVFDRICTARNIVILPTPDPDSRISLITWFVPIGMIIVFMSCIDVRKCFDSELLLESFELVFFCNVDEDTILNVVLLMNIVTKVIGVHWNHDNVTEVIVYALHYNNFN